MTPTVRLLLIDAARRALRLAWRFEAFGDSQRAYRARDIARHALSKLTRG